MFISEMENGFGDLARVPKWLDGLDLDACIRRSLIGSYAKSYGYQLTTVGALLEKLR